MMTHEQAQELGRRLYSRRDTEMVRVNIEGGEIRIPLDADEVVLAVIADEPDPRDQVQITLEEDAPLVVEITEGDPWMNENTTYRHIRQEMTTPPPAMSFDRRTLALTVGNETFTVGDWARTPVTISAHRVDGELEIRIPQQATVAQRTPYSQDYNDNEYCEDCDDDYDYCTC